MAGCCVAHDNGPSGFLVGQKGRCLRTSLEERLACEIEHYSMNLARETMVARVRTRTSRVEIA